MGGAFLDLIYPPHCFACNRQLTVYRDLGFCRPCIRNLPWIGPTFCATCGRYLPSKTILSNECFSCQGMRTYFDEGRVAFHFTHPVRKILWEFKFQNNFGLFPILSRFMVQVLKQYPFEDIPDQITAVPLNWRRKLERGFNQSELLTKAIGRYFKLQPRKLIKRGRFEKPQSRLSFRHRLKNVQEAYTAINHNIIQGSHILLIDDVMTTGNTLNECARIFKKNGCRRVSVLTLMAVSDKRKTG